MLAHSFGSSASAARNSTRVPRENGLTTTAELNPYLFQGPRPVSNQYTYGTPIPNVTGKLIAIPSRTPALALAIGDHRGDASSSLTAIDQPYPAAMRHHRMFGLGSSLATTR